MTGPDLDRLSPADGAVTLRSLDRRFRSAVRPIEDPDIEIWAEIPGPDGHSAADHVAAASRNLTLHRNALHQIAVRPDPFLDEAVMSADERQWSHTAGTQAVELDALGDTGSALADEVDGTAPADWARTARVPGGQTVEAIDILREAVRSALHHLGGAAAAMAAAREA
jgi:hypothetical protein